MAYRRKYHKCPHGIEYRKKAKKTQCLDCDDNKGCPPNGVMLLPTCYGSKPSPPDQEHFECGTCSQYPRCIGNE